MKILYLYSLAYQIYKLYNYFIILFLCFLASAIPIIEVSNIFKSVNSCRFFKPNLIIIAVPDAGMTAEETWQNNGVLKIIISPRAHMHLDNPIINVIVLPLSLSVHILSRRLTRTCA
jgi:hypothetical protein